MVFTHGTQSRELGPHIPSGIIIGILVLTLDIADRSGTPGMWCMEYLLVGYMPLLRDLSLNVWTLSGLATGVYGYVYLYIHE